MHKPYSNEFLSAIRQLGDHIADEFVTSTFANAEQKTFLFNWLQTLNGNKHLSELPEQFISEPIITKSNQLPGWADKKLMKNGAAFFASHAQAIMNLLGLLSLPYCYAAANGAMVLYLSDRIKTDTGKRLADTAQFVWDVMAPDAFEPEGTGFASCLKIRLTHAAARYYTLKSNQWNDSWGTPVNQEDMAGTNLSFSLIAIRGLRKLGYNITYADQSAFIHLWNVIGCLLGLHDDLLPADGKEAFNLEEAIRLRQFRPSAQGKALALSLTQYFAKVATAGPFSSNEVVQIMRYLMGDNIADIIGLPAADISPVQIRLLKAYYFINEVKVPQNTYSAYNQEYQKFRTALSGLAVS